MMKTLKNTRNGEKKRKCLTKEQMMDLLLDWSHYLYEDLREKGFEISIYDDQRQFIPDFVGGYFGEIDVSENSL